MPNFPGSEQWMIGSGYELHVISSIGGPNLNELSAPIHNSRPDPMPYVFKIRVSGRTLFRLSFFKWLNYR